MRLQAAGKFTASNGPVDNRFDSSRTCCHQRCSRITFLPKKMINYHTIESFMFNEYIILPYTSSYRNFIPSQSLVVGPTKQCFQLPNHFSSRVQSTEQTQRRPFQSRWNISFWSSKENYEVSTDARNDVQPNAFFFISFFRKKCFFLALERHLREFATCTGPIH